MRRPPLAVVGETPPAHHEAGSLHGHKDRERRPVRQQRRANGRNVTTMGPGDPTLVNTSRASGHAAPGTVVIAGALSGRLAASSRAELAAANDLTVPHMPRT